MNKSKNKNINVMIRVCAWAIIVTNMVFFLLPVSYSVPSACAQMHSADACAQLPFAMYGTTALKALAVSPSELLIMGYNQMLDLLILYFWRVLVICCGMGILRKDKHMRIFFLTLVSVTIVLLFLDRFLRDGWSNVPMPVLAHDMITLSVMFMYIVFLRFLPVQKEFI